MIYQKDSGMRKERSKWEIIHDLLKVLTEEKKPKKTRIMQRSYLDWRNFQRYFIFLTEENFIAECDTPENGCYELTGKGQELYHRLKFINDMQKL